MIMLWFLKKTHSVIRGMGPLMLIILVVLRMVNCPQFKCKEFFIKQVHYIPDSLEEYRTNCTSSCNKLEPHLVVNHWGNETWIGCFINIEVPGYCVEYNSGIGTLQDHQSGYCVDFDEPCPGKYNSRDSIKYRQCFYRHGGIQTWESLYESKESLEKRLDTCKRNRQDSKTVYFMIIPIGILGIALFLAIIAIITILKNRKQPSYTYNKYKDNKETENREWSTSTFNRDADQEFQILHSQGSQTNDNSAPAQAILHQPCSEPNEVPKGNPYVLVENVENENIDVNAAVECH